MGGQRINYDFMPELARTESPSVIARQASPQLPEDPALPPLPPQSFHRIRGSRDRDSVEFTPLERNDAVSRANALLNAERNSHDLTRARLKILEEELAASRNQVSRLEAKIIALELSLQKAKEEAALMAPTREPQVKGLSPRVATTASPIARDLTRDKSPTAPATPSTPIATSAPRTISPARARAGESNPLRLAASGILARLQGASGVNRSPIFQRSNNIGLLYAMYKNTGELPNCVAQAMIYLVQRASFEDLLRDVSETPLPFDGAFVDDVDFMALPDGKAAALSLMMHLLTETRDDDPVFRPEHLALISCICEQPFKSTMIDSAHTLLFFRLKQQHHRLISAYMKLFHALYKRVESMQLLSRLARNLVPYLMPDFLAERPATDEQRTSPSRSAQDLSSSQAPPSSPRGRAVFDMLRGKKREEKKEDEKQKSPVQMSPLAARDASSTNSSVSSGALIPLNEVHTEFLQTLISEWTLVENISKRVRVSFNEGKPVLRAADLDALIDKLLSPIQPDSDYAPLFFITHTFFTNSTNLFRSIMERQRPNPRTSAESAYNVRIETTLQFWFTTCPPPRDPALLPVLARYLELNPRSSCAPGIADFLRDLPPRSESPPPAVVPKNEPRRLLTLGAEYLSTQLTLIDAELFNKIPRSEIINLTRTSIVSPQDLPFTEGGNKLTDLITRGPLRGSLGFMLQLYFNFSAMATQFNHWAQWTAGEILQSTDLRERTEILSSWIKVARLCYKMGNFNTPFAILSGLSFASISRLSATWRSVPGKRLRRFHELEQLYTSQNAYRNLRFAMQNTPPPGVPYIGLYSKWMASIEENNPNYVDGLVNFQKMDMIYKIWRQVQTYQTNHYNYPYDPELRVVLRSLSVMDQDALYARSLVVEPQPPLSPRGKPSPSSNGTQQP